MYVVGGPAAGCRGGGNTGPGRGGGGGGGSVGDGVCGIVGVGGGDRNSDAGLPDVGLVAVDDGAEPFVAGKRSG